MLQFEDMLRIPKSGIGAEDTEWQENSGQNADGSKNMIPEIQLIEQCFLIAYYVGVRGNIKIRLSSCPQMP